MNDEVLEVWVFHGARAQFASGVFATQQAAEKWIAEHRLTGILTAYPVGIGVYDWAVGSGAFKVTKEKHQTSQFIGGFTSGTQRHLHFEDGQNQYPSE